MAIHGSRFPRPAATLTGAVIATVGWLACAAPPCSAKSLSTAGFEFSDELGGFELIAVAGTGSEKDPITLVERITGPGAAVLVIRIEQGARGDDGRLLLDQPLILAFVKQVTNATHDRWSAFGLELQQQLGKPSGYLDGLSFDQLHQFPGRPIASDVFLENLLRLEPYDGIRFHSGTLLPGGSTRLDFNVTDVTPVEEFYLVQQPEVLTTDADPSPRSRLASLRRADRRQMP